jgi:hypothetical protein
MFVQVIQGKVKDADLLNRQMERWLAEIKPGVKGYLGSTSGLTPDGHAITIARFESAEAAAANSGNALQTAWWNETSKAYDGEPSFHDCSTVDTVFGGGSDAAGFVQVIQGRAKDIAAMRKEMTSMESELRKERPDILGMAIATHDDGSGFTQVIYFRSEAETRKAEKATENHELRRRYMEMFDGPPRFFDLPSPMFD